MNPPNTDIFHKVKQWIGYGDEDLRLARHGLTLSSGCPYRLIAYHAQECTEKYLKAYLVFHRIDFPYTHNISRLLELCDEKSKWAEKVYEAEELTPLQSPPVILVKMKKLPERKPFELLILLPKSGKWFGRL